MWKCYFIEEPPLESYEDNGKKYYYVDTRGMKVGAMWYARDDEGKVLTPEKAKLRHLTKHYWENNSKRPPIMVLLPCKYSTGEGTQQFCVDGQCYDSQRGNYDGWTVSGEPPNITVNPSINIAGSYHGFLQNGVVGQDVDGRNYTLHKE